jgi:DNA-binding IclR family transcriptional regulator
VSAARAEAEWSKTLDRGLRVLETLADAGEHLTAGELAGRLGLHRTVVYRLLGTLERHRLAHRHPDGRYGVGLATVALARNAAAPRLGEVTLPVLSDLAGRARATAFLTVAEGEEATAVAVVEPRDSPIHVAYRVGSRHPLARGASGLAILAARPPRPDERPEVAEARRRGYASTSGELQPGAVGIAAAVPIEAPLEASLGVVALSGLDEASVVHQVLDAAARVAVLLGSRP